MIKSSKIMGFDDFSSKIMIFYDFSWFLPKYPRSWLVKIIVIFSFESWCRNETWWFFMKNNIFKTWKSLLFYQKICLSTCLKHSCVKKQLTLHSNLGRVWRRSKQLLVDLRTGKDNVCHGLRCLSFVEDCLISRPRPRRIYLYIYIYNNIYIYIYNLFLCWSNCPGRGLHHWLSQFCSAQRRSTSTRPPRYETMMRWPLRNKMCSLYLSFWLFPCRATDKRIKSVYKRP